MDRNITATGITMLLKGLESTLGLTVENIEDNGKTQICMGSALTNGLMDEFLQENMIMIKSMDMESMPGLMIENTKVGGKKESKMGLEFTLFLRNRDRICKNLFRNLFKKTELPTVKTHIERVVFQ